MPAASPNPKPSPSAPPPDDLLPRFELNGVDPLSYEVFRAFMRNLHLHRQLMLRTLAEDGAHPGQAVCLRMLAGHDGISQRDLGHALDLTPPTVTAMLQRMEKAGMIERRPDADDQRVTRVHLTDEGRRLEERLRAVFARYIGQAVGSMSDDDRRQLARLLGIVAENTARSLR